jgi:hypothetical protein
VGCAVRRVHRRSHRSSTYRGIGRIGTRVAGKDLRMSNIFLRILRRWSIGGLVVMMVLPVDVFFVAVVQRHDVVGIVVRCSHCPSRPKATQDARASKTAMMYYTGVSQRPRQIFCLQTAVPSRSTGIFAKDRYHNTGNYNIKVSQQASHLVKHTDFVSSLRTSVGMVVVVMELWTTHPTHARFAHASTRAWAHVPR